MYSKIAYLLKLNILLDKQKGPTIIKKRCDLKKKEIKNSKFETDPSLIDISFTDV